MLRFKKDFQIFLFSLTKNKIQDKITLVFERLWRNRHTRTFEGRVGQPVRVQVSPTA